MLSAAVDHGVMLRRLTLLVAMLMSGGNLILPRLALLAVLVPLCLVQGAAPKLLGREFTRVWLLIAVVFMVTMIGSGTIELGANLTRFANIFAGLLLLAIYVDQPRDRLASDLLPILKLFAWQAILTVPFALVFADFFVPITVLDMTYQSFLLIFNYHITLDLPGTLPRPDGFFWEPGVLQIYLNILLYISLFIFFNVRTAALAVVAVFATQSTTGVIVAAAQLGFLYLDRLRTSGMRAQILILLLAPVFLLPIFLAAYSNLNAKMTGAYRGSFWARQYDLVTGIRIANEYPLTGIGFDYERYYMEAQRVGYNETQLGINTISERSNSNSFSSLFASIGYPLGLVFVFGLFKQRFFRRRLVMGVIVGLSLMSEALLLTPMFLMLAFSGVLIARNAAPARSGMKGRVSLPRTS